MKRNINISLLAFAVLSLLIAFQANLYATNGYYSHGYGIRYKGMAGAGVSLSQSALGSATNPAGLVFLGTRYDFNLAVFNPNREFTVIGNPSGFPGTFGLAPGTVTSDNKVFFIPSIGANWSLNDKSSIGVSFYGNGGMNTAYPAAIFGGAQPTGVDLSQMFLNTSYSRKLGENHSVGVSAILAYQRFEATGLEAFGAFSSDPTKLTGNGHDNSYGLGFKVGYMGAIAEGLRLGASYQTQMIMSEFDDYAGLYAEKGGFNIPATWTAGVSYEVLNDWIVAFDVQQILYEDVKSIANPIDPTALPPAFPDGSGGFIPNPNQVALGEDGGSGFGWNNVTVFKLGTMYSGVESWVFRGGFSYGEQPIPDSEMLFNILAPGVIEKHATLGVSKILGNDREISFAMMHGFSNTISGSNRFEAPDQQSIELNMNQWEFELGFSF
ncbi:MAG: outer membrane protein transport protein [Reichenbachiella sp.]|uniref:OmpP1/FadL family transporter n=1 Tax=Reichenbachiella sp. TaxID=2184521 RepID=UPI003265E7DD